MFEFFLYNIFREQELSREVFLFELFVEGMLFGELSQICEFHVECDHLPFFQKGVITEVDIFDSGGDHSGVERVVLVLVSGLVDLHEGEGSLVERFGIGHAVEDVGDEGTVEGDVVESFGVGVEVEFCFGGGFF